MSYFEDASVVYIPSAVKLSKTYSIKPTDGSGDLTFTRSNDTATRVNSSGLIEKVRTNVLLYSQDFSNAAYITTGYGNLPSVSVNTTANPLNGAQDADTATFTAAGTQCRLLQQFTGLGTTNKFTYSIYIKAGTKSAVNIYTDVTDTGRNASFNLSTGTIITQSAGVTASITSAGFGFYRCSVTTLPTTAGQLEVGIISLVGEDGSLILFGAQLELSDFGATDYIATTTATSVGPVANLPRLDYSGGATCPSLLLEPQRTNSASQSEDFNGWPTKVNVTTTANYAVSPDGYQNADRVVFTGNGFMYPASGVNQTNGVVYTLSCYAKRNGSGTQSIGFFKDGSGAIDNAWTLTSNWQRLTYTYTAGNASLAGIGRISGADVSVYGFQFEIGAYATSYIPTLSAAVTRGADACSKTGISSLLPSTEGTVFIDADINFDNSNFTILGSTYVNGATMFTNSVYFYINNNKIDGQIWNTPAFTGWTGLSPSLANGRHKFAISWKASDFVYYIDGNLIASSTAYSAVPTGMNRLDIGDYYGSYGTNNKYNQLLIFKTRLSNADLATLTTI